MAESSLSLNRTKLRLALARFLGYGGTAANWSDAQSARLDEIIDTGLRQLYNPPPVSSPRSPLGVYQHEWKFLKISATLPTVADSSELALPDDFGLLDGGISFAGNEGTLSLIRTEPFQILQRRQTLTSSGTPTHFAIQAQSVKDLTTGQRFEIMFSPTPNAVYNLYFHYEVNANQLTSGLPYAPGGMQHSETIKASCLDVAEREEKHEEGIQHTHWMRQLQASIELDKKAMRGTNLGINTDPGRLNFVRSRTGTVSYNGTEV